MTQFNPLIYFKKIWSLNWTLSISNRNGEDPYLPEYWVHINDFTLSIFYTTHLGRTNDTLSCDCYVLYFHLITQLTLEVVCIYRFYPAQMVLENLTVPSCISITLRN